MTQVGAQTNCVPPVRRLSPVLLDSAMRSYFRRKFADLPDDELDTRIEEALRFLFISHECKGSIPVSREIDDIWHAWILQTQEYFALCEQLPTGRYIHHSSNDYLRHFDPEVGEHENPREAIRMLALYTANFGGFDESATRHWLLAHHLMARWGWTTQQLNDWLRADESQPQQGCRACDKASDGGPRSGRGPVG